MENIWSMENIRKLFSAAKQAEEKGESLSRAFSGLAKELGCSVGSVRNYYYSQAKLFRMMPSLAAEMGIEQAATRARPFVVFEPGEADAILVRALVGKAKGVSVRATIAELAGNDKKLALRYQNKYRSLLLHHKADVVAAMDRLDRDGVAYFNPYSRSIVQPGSKTDLAGVLEKVERLSGEEKELLLRKILL